MDTLSKRQQEILTLVGEKGFVTIEALADSFKVSAQTIRREIIAMDNAGLLQRFHGGAGRVEGTSTLRLGHNYKAQMNREEKEVIAQKVASLITPGSSLYLDVGTTMETAALKLNKIDSLMILTNSMRVAASFDHSRHAVHVLGGEVAGQDGSLVGEQAVLHLRDLRLDFALIGCSGIEASGHVMDFDPRKIAIKQAALAVAKRRYLLATQRKIDRSAFARICHTNDLDAVITGDNTSPVAKPS